MKAYQGTSTDRGPAVVVEDNGHCRGLDPRRDLCNYSPNGFDWSNNNSGAAHLALALAADVLGDAERAKAVHQRLKFKLVGRLADEGWTLTETRIRAAINLIEQEQARRR